MEQNTEKLFYPLQDAYSIKDEDESALAWGRVMLQLTKMKKMNRITISITTEHYDDMP